MNNRSISRMLILILVTAGAVLLAASARSDEGKDTDNRNPIVASWHVTASFDDHRPDTPALYTFNSDRSLTMAGGWPALSGPGHGAWNRDKDDDASRVNLTFFRLLSTSTGAFDGTRKVQAKLTVSDDSQSFTGRFKITRYNPLGKVQSSVTGDLKGTRIVVEPLP